MTSPLSANTFFVKPLLAVLGLILLVGCAGKQEPIGATPELTPVGMGLNHQVVNPTLVGYQPVANRSFHAMWSDDRNQFFTEPRAKRVGDVLTVMINIEDKANLDNASDRSRDSSEKQTLGFGFNLFGFGEDGDAEFGVDSKSSTKGKGAINRKEEIDLQVAAVVTQVLPNHNLVISGSQEVRVNAEVRVLNVEGIVRPRDIAADNMITYDKIAEARISYGGRGRITEVQQPAWGQQIYDRVVPF
ncbi:flagellar basal body L-ring protein FlgH [Cohaesibacter haloalkalitolerans]|uniref:flagellar basal body L-ring protein FlgH n=1 Tax=Cohaesibacter haloalkalitolerans TaxID=1162980 RepID=UPI000E655634|nr:flagellar basal body L-ring protein FlgH [Cohaesibacter haloalkalitolerans]